ncbi:nucleotidyltransferase family protein [Nanoarchaeota archaeon]
MEQKDYLFEIINNLLQNKNHIRGLAKNIEVNHMTILRKIKELEKANVVDYSEEGKNKVYFLKKTIESRLYIFKAENYKLIKFLNKHTSLRKIIDKIQNDKRIKLAIIFGSYAKDLQKKNSDIDIYIETQSRTIKNDIQIIDSRLSVKIGRYDKSNLLIKEIAKDHIIIKGIERYYEKNNFFE